MKEKIQIGERNIPIYKRIFWNLLNFWAWFLPWKKLRVLFHKLKGVKIGEKVEIGYMVFLDNRRPDLITIEKNVTITTYCIILSHDLSRRHLYNEEVIGSVFIKEGAFIGVNSTIMPGVTIGENCIIGAGSVVTEDTSPNSVYVGSPAKKIKELN